MDEEIKQEILNVRQELVYMRERILHPEWIDKVGKMIDKLDTIVSRVELPVKPERAKMSLYKVFLGYGYDFNKSFMFYVIASGLLEAEVIALKTFNSYDYGNCQLSGIEKIASGGQYSKPHILLIAE